jgi:hypothetical protein
MSTLPAWARRLLTKELRFVAEGMEFDREAAQKILPLLAPRKKNEKQKATQKTKLQGAAARRAASAELRAAVLWRSGGFCEVKHRPMRHVFDYEFDHWLGGAGRRKPKETEETLWLLCRECHKDRTANRPSAAYWNELFRRHCDLHGYPFTPHVEHADLPKRAL